MNTADLNLVPLKLATLCLDCETITAGHMHCHACGSRALLNIARALSRPSSSPAVANLEPAAIVQMPIRRRHQHASYARGESNFGQNLIRGNAYAFGVGASENRA